jgi:hypothetical protein
MKIMLFEEWSQKWESPEWWQKGRDYWDRVLPKKGRVRDIFNSIIESGRGASEREWHVLDQARRGNTKWSTKH